MMPDMPRSIKNISFSFLGLLLFGSMVFADPGKTEEKIYVKEAIHTPQFKKYENLGCTFYAHECGVYFKGNELNMKIWHIIKHLKEGLWSKELIAKQGLEKLANRTIESDQIFKVELTRAWWVRRNTEHWNEFRGKKPGSTYEIYFSNENNQKDIYHIKDPNGYQRGEILTHGTWEGFEKSLGDFIGISTKRPINYYTKDGLKEVINQSNNQELKSISNSKYKIFKKFSCKESSNTHLGDDQVKAVLNCNVTFKDDELIIDIGDKNIRVNINQAFQLSKLRTWNLAKRKDPLELYKRKNSSSIWVYKLLYTSKDDGLEFVSIGNHNSLHTPIIPLKKWEEFEKSLGEFLEISVT